jgi:hypothetical protein
MCKACNAKFADKRCVICQTKCTVAVQLQNDGTGYAEVGKNVASVITPSMN